MTRMCTRAERAAVCRASRAAPTSPPRDPRDTPPLPRSRREIRSEPATSSAQKSSDRNSRRAKSPGRVARVRLARDVWLCVLHRSTAQRAMGYIPVCTCRRRDASTRARERFPSRGPFPASSRARRRREGARRRVRRRRPLRPSPSRPRLVLDPPDVPGWNPTSSSRPLSHSQSFMSVTVTSSVDPLETAMLHSSLARLGRRVGRRGEQEIGNLLVLEPAAAAALVVGEQTVGGHHDPRVLLGELLDVAIGLSVETKTAAIIGVALADALEFSGFL